MTKQTKIKMLILAAGVAAYGAAIIVSDRYQMPDDLRLLIFLAAYLLTGIEAFGRDRKSVV